MSLWLESRIQSKRGTGFQRQVMALILETQVPTIVVLALHEPCQKSNSENIQEHNSAHTGPSAATTLFSCKPPLISQQVGDTIIIPFKNLNSFKIFCANKLISQGGCETQGNSMVQQTKLFNLDSDSSGFRFQLDHSLGM